MRKQDILKNEKTYQYTKSRMIYAMSTDLFLKSGSRIPASANIQARKFANKTLRSMFGHR